MSDVGAAMNKLREYADELDQLSQSLTTTQRQFEPVDEEYQEFIESFVAGLYDQYESGEKSGRLPGEDVRLTLARRAMPEELRGRHRQLERSIGRMEERIATLKKLVESQRSILSALKVEMEATAA